MTRFKFLTLLALLLAGTFGCQKEQLTPLPNELHEYHETETHALIDGMEVLDGLKSLGKKHPSAARSFKDQLSQVNAAKNGLELEVTNIIVTPDDHGGHSFVGLLDAFDAKLYKLLSRTDPTGEVYESGVLEIQFDHEFIRSAKDGFLNGSTFTVRGITIEQFTQRRDGFGDSGGLADDCWRMVFGSPDSGGGSDGGSHGSGGGIGTPTNGGYPPGYSPEEQWQNDGCSYEWFTICGCEPMHPGGRQNNHCVCQRPDILYALITCPFIIEEDDLTIVDESATSEKNEYWDCISTLIDYGLITTSDLLQQRLMDCEGLGEVYDTEDNPDLTHPDEAFCTSWMDYKADCLEEEPFREAINTWAELLFLQPAAFEHIVNNDPGCNGGAVAALLLNFPELELSMEEIDLLLAEPEFIEPVRNLLNTNGNDNQLFQIVHALLLNNSGGRPLISSETATQVVGFWVENFTVEGAEYLKENLLYWLYARTVFPNEDNFPDFAAKYLAQEENFSLEASPLTPGAIWDIARPMRDNLIALYPSKTLTIMRMFACRVLGPALEDVVLNSLANFDSRNASLPYPGFTARPDGYFAKDAYWEPPFGPVVPNSIHVITEVKGMFSTGAIFDWSNNRDQFDQYRRFLRENQYEGTAPNLLYLIVPAEVIIDEEIVNACTEDNILLFTSTVKSSIWNEDLVRVTKPIAQNQWDISYHPAQFDLFLELFPNNGLKSQFDFSYINFREALEMKVAQFVASHLTGSSTEECPTE